MHPLFLSTSICGIIHILCLQSSDLGGNPLFSTNNFSDKEPAVLAPSRVLQQAFVSTKALKTYPSPSSLSSKMSARVQHKHSPSTRSNNLRAAESEKVSTSSSSSQVEIEAALRSAQAQTHGAAPYPKHAPAVYAFGITTSLINHGIKIGPAPFRLFLSNFDRAAIGLCGLYDVGITWRESSPVRRTVLLGLQYTAVMSFFQAKRIGGRSSTGNAVMYHAAAHGICTLHHAMVLKGWGKDWGRDWGDKFRSNMSKLGDDKKIVRTIANGFQSDVGKAISKAGVFGFFGRSVAKNTRTAWGY